MVTLIQRIARGDRASFETLYAHFSGLVFSTALQVLKTEADAEDVTQEVFFSLWEKAPLYDTSRGQPQSWIATMARNKAIDRLRAIQRRLRLQDAADEAGQAPLPTPSPEPAEHLDLQEKGILVRNAMLKLAAPQREAIELFYFGELSQQEIARRLRQPPGTIKARVRRGMVQLRRLLGRSL